MHQMEKVASFYPHRNFGGIPAEHSSFEGSPVVVLPVPYDGTTEWRVGSRNGPQAIIDTSRNLEWYDLELGCEIYKIGICTLPEIEPVMSSPEAMVQRVHEVAANLLDKGKFIATLGGEHTITLGVVRALAERFKDLSVLQLDAHADMRDQYLGARCGYATVMRRVLELCPVTQVGIRSLSLEEHEFIKEKKLQPFYAGDLTVDGTLLEKLVASLSKEVYITVDLDVFDPSIMPAVTAPEPGGLTWQQVLAILEAVARQRRVVGFDLVELCPDEGSSASEYLAAKLAYKLIGYARCLPKFGRFLQS